MIQTAFLGDVIMSTPIFKAIKSIWPEALVDVLAIPETASVLKNNPHIHHIYKFDKRKQINKYKSILPLIYRLSKNNYDIAFSIQSSFTSSLIMYLAGIKNRIGYSRQKLLTKKVQVDRKLHIRDRVLLLIKDFSNQKNDNETLVYPSSEDIKKAKSLIAGSQKKKIALAPGSVWETKKWPERYFKELIQKSSDYSIYLIGGDDDFNLCQRLINESNHPNMINCAGKISILESCALIKEMNLVLCNDSAPLHMANAVKTDVFAFFGPTVKKFGCYPYRKNDKILEIDLDCRPCAKHGGNKCPLNHHNCMQEMKPDYVINEIENYFKTK